MSLAQFWVRRARRLLPALAVVVVVCTAAAALVGGDLLVGIDAQVVGAATFTSNWVYIAQGSTYSGGLAPQLFANLWSLAVEEQFYLVWPLAVLAVLALRTNRRRALFVAGCSPPVPRSPWRSCTRPGRIRRGPTMARTPTCSG
ncbi:acyltransferase family protein [Oerskovia sp. M15]